jgi:hypothetical protein
MYLCFLVANVHRLVFIGSIYRSILHVLASLSTSISIFTRLLMIPPRLSTRSHGPGGGGFGSTSCGRGAAAAPGHVYQEFSVIGNGNFVLLLITVVIDFRDAIRDDGGGTRNMNGGRHGSATSRTLQNVLSAIFIVVA